MLPPLLPLAFLAMRGKDTFNVLGGSSQIQHSSICKHCAPQAGAEFLASIIRIYLFLLVEYSKQSSLPMWLAVLPCWWIAGWGLKLTCCTLFDFGLASPTLWHEIQPAKTTSCPIRHQKCWGTYIPVRWTVPVRRTHGSLDNIRSNLECPKPLDNGLAEGGYLDTTIYKADKTSLAGGVSSGGHANVTPKGSLNTGHTKLKDTAVVRKEFVGYSM